MEITPTKIAFVQVKCENGNLITGEHGLPLFEKMRTFCRVCGHEITTDRLKCAYCGADLIEPDDWKPAEPCKNVREIVQHYLKANGFDGLYNEVGPCGCSIDDLMACDGCGGVDICVPGYKIDCETCAHRCIDSEDGEYLMSADGKCDMREHPENYLQ